MINQVAQIKPVIFIFSVPPLSSSLTLSDAKFFKYKYFPSYNISFNQMTNRGDTLHEQQYLVPGQYLANNKGATAILQEDGNFVLYRQGKALWASGTNGKNGKKLIMQTDGNVVLYDSNDHPIWASNTAGHSQRPHFLIMQHDQNLVAYGRKGEKPIWASNTFSHN